MSDQYDTDSNELPQAFEDAEIIEESVETDLTETPNVTTTALVPAAHSFEQYITQVNNAPVLSAEQEWQLAQKLRQHNDLEAAQQLVFSNLRHVVSIARGYSGYGLPIPDLVQEGNVGLMKAVKRYDPDQKVKLMTFAAHWVRAEINEYVMKNWQIVKMATTKAQRKLFFKLRSKRESLGYLSEQEAQSIANEYNVSTDDVYHMEGRFTHVDTAFDAPSDDRDELAFSPSQYLPDYRFSPEQTVVMNDTQSFHNESLKRGLAILDERSRAIIEQRWFSEGKVTLKDLASQYGVSIERIRQIETKAMQQLKAFIESE